MKRLATLLVAIVLGGCTQPPAPVLRTDVQPLRRHWVYRDTDSQRKELGTIESKVIAVDGTKVTQETTETLNGVTTTHKASATFQPDGSLLVEDEDGRVSP